MSNPNFHFDFWVDAHGVEVIFGAIRSRIADAYKELLKLHGGLIPSLYPGATEEGIQAYIDWYEGHIKHLEALIKTMDPVVNPNDAAPPTREQKIGKMADAYRASSYRGPHNSKYLCKLMGELLGVLED